jgi:hypothetical protein
MQHGFTALHYSAAFGHLSTVKVLIKYGARIDVTDAQGKTPQFLAEEGRQPHVATYLAQVMTSRTSCARLRDWLHAVGLGSYYNAFLAQGFDDIDFLATAGLTEADLDAVGVALAGHRSKLLQVYRIHEFTQAATGAAAASEGEEAGDITAENASESASGSDSGSDSGSGSGSDSD